VVRPYGIVYATKKKRTRERRRNTEKPDLNALREIRLTCCTQRQKSESRAMLVGV
jgi:hypothetical protein